MNTELTELVFILDRSGSMGGLESDGYYVAMKSHFRKFGNQMSGSGNHLCEFTRAVFYSSHTPLAWICHAQHQCL